MGRFRFFTPFAAFSIGAVCVVNMLLKPEDAATPAARNSVEVPTSTDVVVAAPVVGSSGRRRLLDSSALMSKIGSPFSEDGTSLWKDDYNVVHVLNTRFMQHQAKLTNLGKARLDLFETFTVPSIKSQSNQQFLWLIWTDANLAESSPAIHQELLHTVADMPNVVVLASEQVDGNLRSFYGHSWSSLSRAMLSGDPKLFVDYHKASHSHVLMETRLDADDALSHTFVESAQAQVAAAMGRGQYTQPGHVQQFCPESHVEWRYYKSNDVNAEDGELIHFDDTNFCIYSGWTTAFHLERENHAFSSFQPRALTNTGCEVAEEDECNEERSLEALFSGNNDDRELLGHSRSYKNSRSSRLLETCFDGAGTISSNPLTSNNDATNPCPANAVPCENFNEVADKSDLSGNAGGTVTVQCDPQGYSDAVDIKITTVEPIEGFTLEVLDPQFFIAYVFLKGGSGGGGMEYEYPYNGGTGGVVLTETLYTAEKTTGNCNVGICRHDLSHMDACLIPRTDVCGPAPDCRRQLRLVPQTLEQQQQGLPALTLPASVLLARTPTAAGMKNVLPGKTGGGVRSARLSTFDGSGEGAVMDQKQAWQYMHQHFGVCQHSVVDMRKRLDGNMKEILVDAFAGQCTPGHSCKESTKKALGHLLDNVYHNEQ